MVKVYIWNFMGKREAWGHASMQVESHYISWWPMKSGQIPSKLSSNIFSAHPRIPDLRKDIDGEGGNPPNHTIIINGLKEQQIISWWKKVYPWAASKQGPPSMDWYSINWNCSKVVATALKEGGGNEYATWSKSWNVVWTPNDVRAYAESIRTGLTS